MTAAYVDIIQSISERALLPELAAFIPDRAVLLLTRLRVDVDMPLSWIKAHADEIAAQHMPGAVYVALNVEPLH